MIKIHLIKNLGRRHSDFHLKNQNVSTERNYQKKVYNGCFISLRLYLRTEGVFRF